MSKTTFTWKPQLVVSAALLLALNPDNPYGYYLLLRVVCFAVFAYVGVKALQQDKSKWALAAAMLAILYNPFLRIHLSRDAWTLINLGTVVFALTTIPALRSRQADTEEGENTEPVAPTAPSPEDTAPTDVYSIADHLIKEQRWAEAEVLLRKEVATNHKNVNAVYFLGKCLEGIGDRENLLTFYRDVAFTPSRYEEISRVSALCGLTRCDPHDVRVWEHLAAFRESQGYIAPTIETLIPLADELERQGRLLERTRVLTRIQEVSDRAAKLGLPSKFTDSSDLRVRDCLARARPYVAQARAERLNAGLEGMPLPEVDPQLRSSLLDGHSVRVPPDVLSSVLHRIRFIRTEQETSVVDKSDNASSRFDPNVLLRAFSSVRPRCGFVLDYVYRKTGHEGSPLLYAREIDSDPIQSVEEFANRYKVEVKGFAPNFPSAFSPAVEFQNSPLGAAEFAIFINEAPFFGWNWHAMYERHKIMLTQEDRNSELHTYSSANRALILSQDLGARLQIANATVHVNMLTLGHDCYELTSWHVQSPNQILGIEHRKIAASDTKVFY